MMAEMMEKEGEEMSCPMATQDITQLRRV